MPLETRNLALRTLDVLEALAGYAASGATNAELAKAADTTAPDISRVLRLLIAKGWATKDADSGRFFPTAAFTRLIFRVDADFSRAQTRLDDRRRNATTG